MDRVYTKEVRERTKEILRLLNEIGFFDSFEGQTTTFAEKYLNDFFTHKLIAGQPLDLGDDAEVNAHLDRIIAGSICYELKGMGYVDSYEDEDTPEVFFMTEKGKELKRKLTTGGSIYGNEEVKI